MKPSSAFRLHRDEIRRLVQQSRASNPRVFGSVLRGGDTESSDLDILVDPLPGATLFDLGGLQIALQELLGVPVDRSTQILQRRLFITPHNLHAPRDIRRGAAGRTDCCSRMSGLQGFPSLRETESWLVSFGKC